jgi:hypothetical protein
MLKAKKTGVTTAIQTIPKINVDTPELPRISPLDKFTT